MESFALLKFWKSNTAKVAAGTTASDVETVVDSAVCGPSTAESDYYDDDDDSFFELELTLPNSKFTKPSSPPKKPHQEKESQPKQSMKPQSPISILLSAPPKLRVFMFGKFKRRAKREKEIEAETVSSFSPRRSTSKLFTVKFKIEDGSFVPELSRSDSTTFSSTKLIHRRSFDDCCESSKRFSKDVVQKYLKIIKPLYDKSSKRENSVVSPTTLLRKNKDEKQSNMFKAKCRHLGKSKSASSTIGAPSPANFSLRDDYCNDGIEGAILHCKRSLNSSKGNPSLSRCSSDPSHEKSLIVSEKF